MSRPVKIYTILEIAIDSRNIYRKAAYMKGLDWLVSYFVRLIQKPGNEVLMLYDGQYPIAFIIMKRDKESWYIHEMAVRKKYRHTGAIDMMKKIARENGIKMIRWERKHYRQGLKTLKLNPTQVQKEA